MEYLKDDSIIHIYKQIQFTEIHRSSHKISLIMSIKRIVISECTNKNPLIHSASQIHYISLVFTIYARCKGQGAHK